MITITVLPVNIDEPGKVTIESSEVQVKEFTFTKPRRLQTFLEGIVAVLPLLDIEYRVVDRREW